MLDNNKHEDSSDEDDDIVNTSEKMPLDDNRRHLRKSSKTLSRSAAELNDLHFFRSSN